MTDTEQTTPPTDEEAWARLHKVWTEDGDPGEEQLPKLRAATTAVRALSGTSVSSSMRIGASYVEQLVATTVAKTMYDVAKALDEMEELDAYGKRVAMEFVGVLATTVTASADSACRVVQGKDPVGEDSFAAGWIATRQRWETTERGSSE